MADPRTASPPGARIAAEAKATLDRQRDGPDRPQQIGEPDSDNSHHQAADTEARLSLPAHIGSRVTIPAVTDSEVEITIVGSYQDGGLQRISTRLPRAMALIGHRIGDEVKVHSRPGTATFAVVQVDK